MATRSVYQERKATLIRWSDYDPEGFPWSIRKWWREEERWVVDGSSYYNETLTPENREVLPKRVTRPLSHSKGPKLDVLESGSWGIIPVSGSPSNEGGTHYPTGAVPYCTYCSDVAAVALASHSYFDMSSNLLNADIDSSLRAARLQAFKASRPNIQPTLSLPNFLLELKDFNRMFHVFDKRHNVRKNIENGILNYNFGMLPFASDCAAIYAGVLRVKKHWEHVLGNQGNTVLGSGRGSFSRQITHNDDYHYGPTDSIYGGIRCRYKGFENVSGQVLCQARYAYDVLDANTGGRSNVPATLYAKSVMQALGVCMDPSIIWNAIPFSFVLDWFLPIGKSLESMRRDSFIPGHTLYSCDMHTKVRYDSTTNGDAVSSYWTSGPRTDYKVRMSNTSYSRSPNVTYSDIQGLNPAMDQLSIRLPSGKHWFLGAVLGSKIFL